MSTIIPSGNPAWVRSSDHTTYGGDLNKTNWHSQGVTNARTDVGAESFCRLAEDMSASMRTAPWALVTVSCDDITPAAPTILTINQMTGARVISYLGSSAPAGFPSASRNGNGDVTISWAASYADDYGVSGTIHIVHAVVSIRGGAALTSAYLPQDNNADGFSEAVRVRLFNPDGTAASSPSFSIAVTTGTT